MTENILDKMNLMLDLRSKNKTLDVNTKIEDKREFLMQDIKRSFERHPWYDCLALEHAEPIAFAASAMSCGVLAQVIRKSFKAHRYRLVGFSSIVLPIFLGSVSAVANGRIVNSMFKLEVNCRECYRMKLIGVIAVFPLFNQAAFSSLLTWVGQNEKKNIFVFRRLRDESWLQFAKRQCSDYLQKIGKSHIWTKSAAVVVVVSALAYLIAMEQQREFTKVFTRYYEDLLEEVELGGQNFKVNENPTI